MARRDKINYYLDIAEAVSKRSTCTRYQYGAIIVKNDEILSTGYSGAPRGRKNCTDLGYCTRQRAGVPHGQCLETCRAVHAEANAIISVARRDSLGATMYLVGRDPNNGQYVENTTACSLCRKFIINAGITTVIIRQTENDYRVVDVDAEWVSHDDSILE